MASGRGQKSLPFQLRCSRMQTLVVISQLPRPPMVGISAATATATATAHATEAATAAAVPIYNWGRRA